MSDFVEQLRLAEKAAEDIYFSKVDQQLIEALHKQMQTEKEPCQPSTEARGKTARLSRSLVQPSTPVASLREED